MKKDFSPVASLRAVPRRIPSEQGLAIGRAVIGRWLYILKIGLLPRP